MTRVLAIVALAAVVGGCASRPAAEARVEEGRRFAQRACAGCHATGLAGLSPNPQSPPFRTLAARLPGEALTADLSAIAARGHGQMPPIYMTPGEIRAVAAYIRSVAERSAV